MYCSVIFKQSTLFFTSISDSNKISMICSIVKSLWNTVGSATSLKDDFHSITSSNTNDAPLSSRPCVHIPHIERELSLLLSCLLQKV